VPTWKLTPSGFHPHVCAEPSFSGFGSSVAPTCCASLFVRRVQGSTSFSDSPRGLELVELLAVLLPGDGLIVDVADESPAGVAWPDVDPLHAVTAAMVAIAAQTKMVGSFT
jgi:hypothetical protein